MVENNLGEKISHINANNKDIYLVGTAHVSRESVEDVRRCVEYVKPDSICVELCPARHKTLTEPDNWQKMDIFKIIKEKKAVFLLAQLMMTSFYRQLGEKLGIQPGAEMLEGVKLAEQTGAKLVLADRNIEITLKRVWGNLGSWSKIKLMFNFLLGIFSSEEIDTELIEKMKKQDQLEAVMAEFTGKFPQIKKSLIDERDIYLAQKIRSAGGDKVVAVVGAGHVDGIKQHIQEQEPLAELMLLPKKSIWPRIIKWAIPVAILALIGYGFFKDGAAHSVENIYIWILVNGIFSAIGVMIAFGHPVTIISAFLAAPITSLNPMIAAGWVAGLVQAIISRPKVNDFEELSEAISSIKGFWKNKVTKILLVTALANLGSMIGTWIAGIWIAGRTV